MHTHLGILYVPSAVLMGQNDLTLDASAHGGPALLVCAFCRCFVSVASDVKGADLVLWWAGRGHCRNTRDVNPDVEQAGGSAIGTELDAVEWHGGLRREKKELGSLKERTLNAAEQAHAFRPPPLGSPWA